MGRFRIGIPILLMLFSNCAILQLRSFLEDPVSDRNIILPIQLNGIVISDTRRIISDRDIKISWFAWPGDKDEVFPALSDSGKDEITADIMEHIRNRNNDYKVSSTVEIVEGVKRYKCSWLGEDMYVKSVIRITLYDQVHLPCLIMSTGEAYYTFKSNIATSSNIEKLYQKAIDAAIFKAIESIRGNKDLLDLIKQPENAI